MNWIGVIVIIAIIGSTVLHFLADLLNLRNLKTILPESFHGWYDEKRYKSSQEYLYANTRFEWIAAVTDTSVFLIFWFGKGFAFVDQWVRSVSTSPVICGLIYIGVLFFAKTLISLPFSVYSTFVIEEKFGFNKTTWPIFVADLVKKLLLATLLGGVLLTAVLMFFEFAGPAAWIYCWILVIIFIMAMQVIVPTWIMPLFNKFKPLEEGDLKIAILSYASSIHFPLQNVFVMDGSKRSSKSNAFFTGFGKHKRIVLFDTLINNHSIPELVAILGHEMGHYKKRHILWMMIAGILQSGIMLYLLSLFISSPALFNAFYIKQPSVYAGLVFFGILYAPIDFFLGILMQVFSRRNEYSADRFAVETTKDPDSFVTALKKLSVHNLSNLTPHPFYVFLNYSHPPVLERINAIGDM